MNALFQNPVTAWVTISIGVTSAAVTIIGEVCNWPAVSANSALIVLSWFYVLLAIPLIVRERVLLVGVLPGTVAVFATWLPLAFAEAEQPEFFILLPLPLVAAFLVLWTPVTWGMFQLTRRWSSRRLMLGAAAETGAMCLLLVPWLLAAVVLPAYLDQSNDTVAAVVAIAFGLLWSKLISDPFARFVKSIM